jgi:hypothetical protein
MRSLRALSKPASKGSSFWLWLFVVYVLIVVVLLVLGGSVETPSSEAGWID